MCSELQASQQHSPFTVNAVGHGNDLKCLMLRDQTNSYLAPYSIQLCFKKLRETGFFFSTKLLACLYFENDRL